MPDQLEHTGTTKKVIATLVALVILATPVYYSAVELTQVKSDVRSIKRNQQRSWTIYDQRLFEAELRSRNELDVPSTAEILNDRPDG